MNTKGPLNQDLAKIKDVAIKMCLFKMLFEKGQTTHVSCRRVVRFGGNGTRNV
jgi:hypothetical protein